LDYGTKTVLKNHADRKMRENQREKTYKINEKQGKNESKGL
jgi:hypothetical protein